MAKNSLGIFKKRLVALHDNGQDYKKIVNTLKLSCSTVAEIIQRFKRVGSTQNRPRVGRPKKLSVRAERHIQMLSLKDQRRSALSIAAEIEMEVCKVSNICQLRDVVMEEWKSIPVATCEALVNSIPRRVKAVLDNDGGHTKY